MKKLFLLFLAIFINTKTCEISYAVDKRLFSRDIKEVQAAINDGAYLNAKNDWGKTPLMHSITHGKFQIAKLLIECKADLNIKQDKWEDTALITAALNREVEISKLLIASGADLNILNRNGYTALMTCAFYNILEIAKILINSGAGINATNKSGNSALIIAVICNKLSMVKLLIDSGANIYIQNEDGDTALMIAQQRDNAEIIKLIKDRMEYLKIFESQFINAAREGKTKEVVQLIEQGVNINAQDEDGFTALMRAAQGSNDSEQAKRKLDVVKILLDNRADFNLKDDVMNFTALKWAEENSNVPAENFLKKAGASK